MSDTTDTTAAAAKPVTRRQLKRAAGRAMHEVHCGTPPSCGLLDPCSESAIDPREVTAAVAAVMDELRAAGWHA